METNGAIVCGLNPARSGQEEQRYYVTHGASYGSVVKYWNTHIRHIPYYQKLRKLVDALNLAGPILWTDTVKCEKQKYLQGFSHSLFPDTVRRCTANYLHSELAACPPDWIAIGVGRDAFTTLSLICPGRFVLGVPHCVGQGGAAERFDSLFIGNRLKPRVMARFQGVRAAEPTGALWLTG
ncbi:MAG TPA: uracil-DNA glycosylase family protein [Verrucomicrobiae bacterium]|nr:uracil-DNA glycosylase family protein [Verrucomicrobiae bacterium]